ncbi:MAG: CHAT domain-containing protein, partial [Symploca sp. SIO1A3]|nr:CHAT domain-containing protein [Symploca sp. SIO1A3]
VKQLSATAKEQSLQLGNLRKLSNNLQQLQQNAVLLYPLILEDRLELVLATPNSPPINRTVSVKREELNRTIVQFRQALEQPTSDALTPASQLYDWLIKPLENDLTTAEAQTIIYAPDGQLRYIPLAALHDGNQWLIERFRVNNITAASIDDLNTQPQSELSLLAAAFAQGKYNIQAGKQQFSFSGLPFAGKEVENLATTIPSTTKLVDDDFSKAATLPQMDSHSVVHFATHAAFVPGSPDDSFILFGNGDYVTLGEVREEWFFTNVDLIVLSACDTGVGGMGNGEEILGFGYLMQNAGARAAIASLWSVSDGGTQALMNSFYGLLTTGKHTKAEALRQAQIALITGDYSAVGDNRGSLIVEYVGSQLPPDVSKNLKHPYYWAPFILIGNGL